MEGCPWALPPGGAGSLDALGVIVTSHFGHYGVAVTGFLYK